MLLSRDNTPCLKTKCSFFLISPRASHSILQHLKTTVTWPRIMSDTVKTIIQVNTVTNHRIICPHNSNSITPHPNTCPSLQPAPSKANSNSTIYIVQIKGTITTTVVMAHFRSNNSYWTIRTITCSSRILLLEMLLHLNLNICYHLSSPLPQTSTKLPSIPPAKPPC